MKNNSFSSPFAFLIQPCRKYLHWIKRKPKLSLVNPSSLQAFPLFICTHNSQVAFVHLCCL